MNRIVVAMVMGVAFVSLCFGGASVQAASTQGEFAVKLVEHLGLGKNMEQDKAIQLLYSLSIRPNVLPTDDGWQKDEPATDRFVAYIQASIQTILKNVCYELNIAAPPTLDLHIIELPPSPQQVFFEAGKPPAELPSAGKKSPSAGPPSEMPPDPPMLPPHLEAEKETGEKK